MAYKRKRMTRKKSRRVFRRNTGTHRKNISSTAPMRGGIRL